MKRPSKAVCVKSGASSPGLIQFGQAFLSSLYVTSWFRTITRFALWLRRAPCSDLAAVRRLWLWSRLGLYRWLVFLIRLRSTFWTRSDCRGDQRGGAADGIVFKYSFSATGGLPPGLTLSPSGLLSGTFTASGDFSFTLTINFTLTQNGSVLLSEDIPIPFDLTVTGFSGAQVTVDPPGLNFNLTQHGTPSTKSVTLTNRGNQAASFSASATTNSGGPNLAEGLIRGRFRRCLWRVITLHHGRSIAVAARHILGYCYDRLYRGTEPESGHDFGGGRSFRDGSQHWALPNWLAIPGRRRRNRDLTADHNRFQ